MNRISTTEAAERLFISSTSFAQAFNRGEISGVMVGAAKKIRLDLDAADRFGLEFHRRHLQSAKVNKNRMFHRAAYESIRLRTENDALRAFLARKGAPAPTPDPASHPEPVHVISSVEAVDTIRPGSVIRRFLGR